MTVWQAQPPAIRASLNPVLVGAILAWTCDGYRKVGKAAMPWPLLFVAPALVLHAPTRDALPAAASKRLLSWRDENERLVADLPDRCLAMRPFVRSGLRTALRQGILTFEGTGAIGKLPASRTPPELQHLQRAAALVGRWLAAVPAPTAMSQLGMAP